MKHLSVSKVLKWSEVSPAPLNKLEKDIPDTPNRLIISLESTIIPEEKYLLDSHFCLFDSIDIPQNVSISTFQKIAPIAIPVVTTDTLKIANRLKERDSRAYKHDELNNMQISEKSQAISVAKELDVQFFEIKNGNVGELMKFLSN